MLQCVCLCAYLPAWLPVYVWVFVDAGGGGDEVCVWVAGGAGTTAECVWGPWLNLARSLQAHLGSRRQPPVPPSAPRVRAGGGPAGLGPQPPPSQISLTGDQRGPRPDRKGGGAPALRSRLGTPPEPLWGPFRGTRTQRSPSRAGGHPSAGPATRVSRGDRCRGCHGFGAGIQTAGLWAAGEGGETARGGVRGFGCSVVSTCARRWGQTACCLEADAGSPRRIFCAI